MSSDDGDSKEEQQTPTRGLALSRSRRPKNDKYGRQAALDRLRRSKATGERVKYESKETDDVYKIVDEDEYSELVNKRLDDDWIEDDGTGMYVEDGREIFDDETTENMAAEKNKKIATKNQKPQKKDNDRVVKSSDIKQMFLNSSKKAKKTKQENLKPDSILGNILDEISSASKPSSSALPTSSIARTPVLKKKKLLPPSWGPSPSYSQKPRKKLPKYELPSSSPTVANVLKVEETQDEPVDNDDYEVSHEVEEMDDDVVKPPPKKMKMDTEGDKSSVNEMTTAVAAADDAFDDMSEIDMIDFDDIIEQEAEANVKSQVSVKTETVGERKQSSKAETFSLGWEDIKPGQNEQENSTPLFVNQGILPMTSNNDGNQVFRFYWLDAHEDHFKQNGQVYLFGKVYHEKIKGYLSCCVLVQNIDRIIYLLPRKKETGEYYLPEEVYKEFDSKVADKYGFMKYKTKVVERKNVFGGPDIPHEAQYLEITYPAKHGTLPSNLSGETFSRIFGSNQSPLESLLLTRQIKGPSWLDISKCEAKSSSAFVSHCKLEVVVSSPGDILVTTTSLPPPPLVVMTLSLKTVPNLKTHQNEIVGIAGLVHSSFYVDKPAPKPAFQKSFFSISKPKDCIFPYDFRDVVAKGKKFDVDICVSEKVLLSSFLAKMVKEDPDVVIGHSLVDFGLDVLLHRLNTCKVPTWSKLGRLKRQNMPKMKGGSRFGERLLTTGRLICDVKISAKELIRCKSYDLSALVEQVLHKERRDLPSEQIKDMFTTSQNLLYMIEHTLVDANSILDIACELQVLPLAMQVTNIAGNVLSRTLMGGRAERNEFLLLHAFHDRGYLPPDKTFKKKETNQKKADETELPPGASGKPRNKKAAYEGGLVLEPKRGFYDKYILLLDFNSLYPSIIQEYNICFTTLASHAPEGVDEATFIPEMPESGLDAGVLPTEIRKLVERRKQVKQLMKAQGLTKDQYIQYDIRQKALKLTANSMYGCLGYVHSRFFAKPLAALITRQGREILMNTKELAQKMGLEVIYGDTDSIMINTNSTDMENAFKLGNQVKAEVNKLYRLLEIDIDGVYKSLLLLKKKKYAALSIQKLPDGSYKTTQELKGLDIVRRDWCDLAKDAGNFAVSQILSDQSRETIVEKIHESLQEIGNKVKEGSFPNDKFIIRKELTRDPELYPGKDNLPHVRVAIRVNKSMKKRLKSGDIVSYVICEDGTTAAPTQRSYSVEELLEKDSLKIDENYYLSSQVHPVVSRLCEPIDGTDAALIAQCLGLDASGFKKSRSGANDEEDEESRLLCMQASEEERFFDCKNFKFVCPDSKEEFEFGVGVFAETDPSWTCTLALPCGGNKPMCDRVVAIQNQLTLTIREDIKKYYQGWLVCDDPACAHRTRSVPVLHDARGAICSVCYGGVMQAEFSYRCLYQQLCYYKLQFDVDYALKKYKQDGINSAGQYAISKYRRYYKLLTDVVDLYLTQNGYNQVSLPALFSWMRVDAPKPATNQQQQNNNVITVAS